MKLVVEIELETDAVAYAGEVKRLLQLAAIEYAIGGSQTDDVLIDDNGNTVGTVRVEES